MEPIQLEAIRARRLATRETLDRYGDAYCWQTGRTYLGDVGVLLDAMEELKREVETWKRKLQASLVKQLEAEERVKERLAHFANDTRAWQEERAAYEYARPVPPRQSEMGVRASITRQLLSIIEGEE